jgi:hypothetical protein
MGAPAKKIADRTHLGVYSGPFFLSKTANQRLFCSSGAFEGCARIALRGRQTIALPKLECRQCIQSQLSKETRSDAFLRNACLQLTKTTLDLGTQTTYHWD